MISIDYETKTINRGRLSNLEVYNELNRMWVEDSELRKYHRLYTRHTRRVFRIGNVAMTRIIYDLRKGWKFKKQ